MLNSNSFLTTEFGNEELPIQIAYSFTCIKFSEFDPLVLIEPLLETDSSVLTHQDEEGNTLLHYAAYKGFSLTVDKLLQKGADPNIRNNKGDTPLLVISQLSEITNDHYRCIEKLLNFSPDRIASINSILHIAARREVTYLLKHAIQEAKSNKLDINLQDKDEFTPLDYLMKNISLHVEKLNSSQKILEDFLVIKQFIDFLDLCGARYNFQNRESMNISAEWGRALKPLGQSFTTNDLNLFSVINGFIQLLSTEPAFSENLEVNKVNIFKNLALTLQKTFTADSTINSIDLYGMTPLDHAICAFLPQAERNTQCKNHLLILKSIFSEMLAAGAKLNKTNWEKLSSDELVKLLRLNPNYPNRYYLNPPLLPKPTNPISALPYSFFPSTKEDVVIEKIRAKNDFPSFLGL